VTLRSCDMVFRNSFTFFYLFKFSDMTILYAEKCCHLHSYLLHVFADIVTNYRSIIAGIVSSNKNVRHVKRLEKSDHLTTGNEFCNKN